MFEAITHRVRRVRCEEGFAIPTVLAVLVAAFAVGSAAVVASMGAQSGATRDLNTKAALAAAEDGVENALLRYNRIGTNNGAELCRPVTPHGQRTDGWCAAPVADPEGRYLYWVRPTPTELEIVSAGTVDGVTRRVLAHATSAQSTLGGKKPFTEHSVIGLDYVTQGANTQITASVATNGDVTQAGTPNSVINCTGGNVQVGPSGTVKPPEPNIDCPITHGWSELTPVNQGDVAQVNDNDRITKAVNGQTGGDTVSGNRSRVDWDPVARTLTLNQNVSITLGGANYSLCRLETKQNTNIFVVSGAQVRIYFDAPENCGFTSATTQLKMNQNSSIQASGGSQVNLALLFVGSDAIPTSIELAQNTQAPGPCSQQFVLYAPRSAVSLAQNAYVCGAIAGKSISVAQNSRITASNLASEFELPGTESQYFTGYKPGTFIECTATDPPSGAPDQGC
ncbi:MAG TPA: hypothetical protein VIL04_12635 [Solirubrobacterales bacterium]